ANLPDYMVPSAFVTLDTLPLTPNGKLDRNALPAPDYSNRTTGRAPRTPREEILCGLYADILNVTHVTIDDNFFQLGGDSIMSIQLVARARRAGLELSVRDVFQHKTVAAIATVVTEASEPPVEAAGTGVGPMPLTPIMRQFLERGGPVDQYNQSRLVQVPAGLDGQALISAVQAVLDRHDALRARLSWNGQEQFLDIAPRGAVSADACVSRVDAAKLDDAARRALITEETTAARQRLDATRGKLTQFVWFDQGASAPGLLLVLIHHLAVDGVSWRILVPDLAEAYREAQSGRVPELPPVGTSMRGWARGLAEAAGQPKWAMQTAFWRDMLGGPAAPLGGRRLDAERDIRDNAGHLSVRLPVAVTEAVLTRVPQVFHSEVNDVLLAAFAVAWARWRRNGGGGGDSVLLDLEGHGREDSVSPGADLSRTVGWFTSHHPVRLDTGLGDEREIAEALAGGPAAGSVLKHVKERLRAVPDKGMGYGLVRYRNPETAAEFAGLPAPEVSFNYLGRFTTADAEDAGTFRAPDWTELSSAGGFGASDPRMPMAYKLDLVARTQDGPRGPQLTASWSWPRELLDEADIQHLARLWFDALEGLTEHARQPDAGGMTPSDASLSLLDQSEIEQLESDWREHS
ncbi:condensation domain-containing protein, partial [Streptomyces parvus]